MFSADTKGIKIWNEKTGENYTSLETAADINDLCVVPDSGLFFVANESADIFTYFIPSLAPAPKWCSYLDNITEELEESAETTVYDDYKFVSRDEVQTLGIENLVGTPMLRAYMHGYFMDARLYREAKSAADPFAYDEYRKQRIEKMLEEGTAKRMQLAKAKRALPKVNKRLAARLLDAPAAGKKVKAKKQEKSVGDEANPIGDARFQELFTNKDFQVDEESEEYRLLHPSESRASKPDLLATTGDTFTAIEESDDENDGNDAWAAARAADEDEVDGKESDAESSDDDRRYREAVAEKRERLKKLKKVAKKSGSSKGKGKGKVMLELGEGESFNPGTSAKDLMSKAAAMTSTKSFGARLAKGVPRRTEKIRRIGGGSKELTFSRRREGKSDDDVKPERRSGQRSIGGLGLKRSKKQAYWRGRPV